VLETHPGAARRITARDLAVILEIQDPTGKTIRALVNGLIDEGLAVGSINAETGGYFLISNEQELAASVRHLESRAAAILGRVERPREAFHHGPRQPVLPTVGA